MPRPLKLNIETLPKTKEEVINSKQGKGYYYPDTPCKNGHMSPRYFYKKRSACRTCRILAQRVINAKVKERDQVVKQQNTEAYRKKYPWRVNEYKRMRQLKIKQATPKWADKNAILEIYKKAHELSVQTGVKYSVDHIIPLKGKLVCGLHIETNLAIITLADNKTKNNQFTPLGIGILTKFESS